MPTATLAVKNMTGGSADITVAHRSSTANEVESNTWLGLSAGEDSGTTFEIQYDASSDANTDYWYVGAAVANGPQPGIYESSGTTLNPRTAWGFQPVDDSRNLITIFVYTNRFRLDLARGTIRKRMRKTGPYTAQIRHVFVLMLENRSFDHLFGWTQLAGTNADPAGPNPTQIEGADSTMNNLFGDQRAVCAAVPAGNMLLSAGPGHEFEDVMENFCGAGHTLNGGAYPAINLSGFATNYVKALTKAGVAADLEHVNQVMSGVSPDSGLVLHDLARDYAICDHWFASLPGPTWPNRFFALAGSSSGLEVSPSSLAAMISEGPGSYKFEKGTVFSALRQAGCKYRIYKDKDNGFAANPAGVLGFGGGTICTAMDGIRHKEVMNYSQLATDLDGRYPYQLTFIEPHYGASRQDTFVGGSSQHPVDVLEAGDALIASTFNAIRNSAHWEDSLLIITYDEAGGLFDHVTPPGSPAVAAPADSTRYSKHSFDFKQLGPRVPAVVVSPRIRKGTIDHATYDHTSIISTVLQNFVGPRTSLTKRDLGARTLTGLLQQEVLPDDSRPTTYAVRQAPAPRSDPGATDQHTRDADPLPEEGNDIGFVLLAAKTDIELSDGTPQAQAVIAARVQSLKTYGQAQDYVEEVLSRANQDQSESDQIDDLIYGEAADTVSADIAANLGLSAIDLQALVAASVATSLHGYITGAALDATRTGSLLKKIEEYEATATEIFDVEDVVYRIPRGTTSLLRSLPN